MTRKIISILTISAAALAASMSFASGSDDQAEVQTFLKAPHDITAAIKAAEAASGGAAISAEFDVSKDAGYYEIDTVTGDKLAELKVDATSGQVTETKDKGLLSAQDDDDAHSPAQLGAPLTELVAKAEAAGQGKVMSIGLEGEDNAAPVIEVELAKDDATTHSFILNATDGTLAPMTDDGEDHEG